jgi:hypothetical protein
LDTSRKRQPFTLPALWTLFVTAAFPLHLWAIIVLLKDLSGLVERTNIWDAIGVAGYGMMFALIESLFIFTLLVFIGWLLSKIISFEKRLSLLGSTFFIITIWVILVQQTPLLELPLSIQSVMFQPEQTQQQDFVTGLLLLVMIPLTILCIYLSLSSHKFQQAFLALIDRISPLMGLYLLFDFAGIVIVFLRNIG